MTKAEVSEVVISANQQGFYQIPLQPQIQAMTVQRPMVPNEWIHPMCGCFGDCDKCCIGFFCPCITYGEIQHRMKNQRQSNYNRCCNGPCWGFCGLSLIGMQWIMGMMQRGEARRKYNMKGSGCGDCMRHFCCGCCSLIQEDREIETRKQLLVPVNVIGYQPAAAMTYDQTNGVAQQI